MNISIREGAASAGEGRGWVVVIDVLRAFTTTAHALAAGAERIVLVGSVEEALARRASTPGSVAVGEVDGRPIPGFDFGNSPDVVSRADLRGRTVILRSSSGTQGVVRATAARGLLVASLSVASATARYLQAVGAREVLLVATGMPDGSDGDEDVACAELIRARLRGEPCDPREVVRRVVESPAGRRAQDPAVDWISAADLRLATEIDRFDFAIVVERDAGDLVARAIRAPSRS